MDKSAVKAIVEVDPRPDFAVTIDLFNNVQVGVFLKKEDMTAWFKERDLDSWALKGANAAAHYVEAPEGPPWFLMYLPKETPPQTIAHECLHSAWNILEHMGIEVDFGNHEVLAYTMQSLMKQVLEELAEPENETEDYVQE